MISLCRQFALVEIGKTASTSMTQALLGFEDLTNQEKERHNTAEEYRDMLGDILWNDFYKFSVVRNPYDRAVSSWFYRRNFKLPGDNDYAPKNMTLRDFLAKHPHINPDNPEWRSHLAFLTVDGRVRFDRLVDYENIAKEWPLILEDLGLEPIELRRLNATRKKRRKRDFLDYYDEETAAVIEKLYADDFKWQADNFPVPWRRFAD